MIFSLPLGRGFHRKMKNQWCSLDSLSRLAGLHCVLNSDRWCRCELIGSLCSDSPLPTTECPISVGVDFNHYPLSRCSKFKPQTVVLNGKLAVERVFVPGCKHWLFFGASLKCKFKELQFLGHVCVCFISLPLFQPILYFSPSATPPLYLEPVILPDGLNPSPSPCCFLHPLS